MNVCLRMQDFVFNELKKSIKEQERLVLLLGKSGLGKSFLLKKLCQEENYILFAKPFFDEKSFIKALFENCFNQNNDNFDTLYEQLKKAHQKYIFLLDEVGMYEENLLEKVRILSDLTNVSFVLALHKKQELLCKEHFSSRISKEFKLEALDLNDLALYAREKFDLNLDNKHLNWLLKISCSNLRTVDKVLATFIKLYDFYESQKRKKSTQNILEMSAFHHKLLGK